MNQELYDSIYSSLTEVIDVKSAWEQEFLNKLTIQAVAGAQEYVNDLEESVGHLKETIKRLTKE
jgi:archaellum component FlaC